MLAAVASDLDRRLSSLPSDANNITSSPSVSPGETAAGQIKTADLNRLAETLKLRLAAVSPSIVERSEDPATGLVEYVDELVSATESRQRLVPKYLPDKRTQRIQLTSYVPVATIPGFTAF